MWTMSSFMYLKPVYAGVQCCSADGDDMSERPAAN